MGGLGQILQSLIMKYIEEINCGDCFEYQNQYYVLTQDFKKNGQKLCINLINGFGHWFKSDLIVDSIDLFRLDADNNVIAIKERKKTDVTP
jgi:hypothetical protein